MRGLACCGRDNEPRYHLDKQETIRTYDGLESCIQNSCSYDGESSTSKADACATDSLDEDGSVCSSSKDASGSFSSRCLVNKREKHESDVWEEVSDNLKSFDAEEKQSISVEDLDVETMKEKFAKLLLGDDVSGGCNGLSTALALSHAITNLAVSVFGELWRLEPLSEEKKTKWRREMNWFISPANYMIDLVPAKQYDTNGRSLEVMTPKARSDINVNLPALQKLDSMLIETLDSMVNTEFWYAEEGSKAEGRSKNERSGKRWWLPSPQVPTTGLSVSGRKKLLSHGKVVHQVFKAAKVINSNVLLDMPVPTAIKNAFPKSGKANLGEKLYKILSKDPSSPEEMIASLDLKTEHTILQTMNQLETATLAWKEKISDQVNGKSPARNSWFVRDLDSEVDRTEFLLDRAETLLEALRIRYQNLPQTFIEATKVQYNKDIGHSILEAYSRVVRNLAFSILSRIKDILQQDDLTMPNSPDLTCCFSGLNLTSFNETPAASGRVRYSLIDQMKADGQYHDSNADKASNVDRSNSCAKISALTSASSRSKIWCIGVSPTDST